MTSRALALFVALLIALPSRTACADDALIGPPPPPPGNVGNGLIVSGGVVGAVGLTVATVAYFAWFFTSFKYIDPDPDYPPPVNPAEAPAKAALIGGGVAFLVGGVLLLTGLGVRAHERRARRATPTAGMPLEVRF